MDSVSTGGFILGFEVYGFTFSLSRGCFLGFTIMGRIIEMDFWTLAVSDPRQYLLAPVM